MSSAAPRTEPARGAGRRRGSSGAGEHLPRRRLLRRDPGAELRDQQLAPVLHVAELIEAADQEVLHPEVPVLQQRIGDLLAGAHVPARVALRAHPLGEPEPQPLIVHIPFAGEALQAIRGDGALLAGPVARCSRAGSSVAPASLCARASSRYRSAFSQADTTARSPVPSISGSFIVVSRASPSPVCRP